MKIIEKKYCSKCKKGRAEVKYSKTLTKTGYIQYFYCNPCNTERMRNYIKTEKGAKNVRENVYKSIKKHPEKQKARIILNNHVKTGRIKKPKNCSICKKSPNRIEAHHEDYSKPLEIIWCCKMCHRNLDKKLKKEDN